MTPDQTDAIRARLAKANEFHFHSSLANELRTDVALLLEEVERLQQLSESANEVIHRHCKAESQAIQERDSLKAEVERMREVVEAARRYAPMEMNHDHASDCGCCGCGLLKPRSRR